MYKEKMKVELHKLVFENENNQVDLFVYSLVYQKKF